MKGNKPGKGRQKFCISLIIEFKTINTYVRQHNTYVPDGEEDIRGGDSSD